MDFTLDIGFSGDIFLEKTVYEELGLHLAAAEALISSSPRTRRLQTPQQKLKEINPQANIKNKKEKKKDFNQLLEAKSR